MDFAIRNLAKNTAAENTAASQALFDATDSRPRLIKVAATEPHGGSPTIPTEPTGGSTYNNYGGNAESRAAARANASAHSDATSNATATNGGNTIKQNFGGSLFLPSNPGGECTQSTGGLLQVFGFGGGLVESHPDEKCMAARNEVVKKQTQCDYSVQAGVAALNGLDQAGANVDRAKREHSLPHLDIANQQQSISADLAAGSAAAARNCVGDVPPPANQPPRWGAADLNAMEPPPQAPAPVREIHHAAPPVHHHVKKAPVAKDGCNEKR